MKKLLAMSALIASMLASCSGGDDSESVNNNDDDGPTVENDILVKDITVTPAGGAPATTTYNYDGNLISTITYPDGSHEELLYNEGGDIARIDKKMGNQVIEYSLFDYNEADDLGTRTRYILNEDGGEPTVYISDVSYPLSTKFVISNYLQGTMGDYSSMTYTLYARNVTMKENHTDHTDSVYQYDDKFSPFANIADFDNMQVLYPYITFRNVRAEQGHINGVNAGQYYYEYVYNEDNFPIEAKRYNNGNGQLMETKTFTYHNN